MGLYPKEEEEAKALGNMELLNALCWAFLESYHDEEDVKADRMNNACEEECLRRMSKRRENGEN